MGEKILDKDIDEQSVDKSSVSLTTDTNDSLNLLSNSVLDKLFYKDETLFTLYKFHKKRNKNFPTKSENDLIEESDDSTNELTSSNSSTSSLCDMFEQEQSDSLLDSSVTSVSEDISSIDTGTKSKQEIAISKSKMSYEALSLKTENYSEDSLMHRVEIMDQKRKKGTESQKKPIQILDNLFKLMYYSLQLRELIKSSKEDKKSGVSIVSDKSTKSIGTIKSELSRINEIEEQKIDEEPSKSQVIEKIKNLQLTGFLECLYDQYKTNKLKIEKSMHDIRKQVRKIFNSMKKSLDTENSTESEEIAKNKEIYCEIYNKLKLKKKAISKIEWWMWLIRDAEIFFKNIGIEMEQSDTNSSESSMDMMETDELKEVISDKVCAKMEEIIQTSMSGIKFEENQNYDKAEHKNIEKLSKKILQEKTLNDSKKLKYKTMQHLNELELNGNKEIKEMEKRSKFLIFKTMEYCLKKLYQELNKYEKRNLLCVLAVTFLPEFENNKELISNMNFLNKLRRKLNKFIEKKLEIYGKIKKSKHLSKSKLPTEIDLKSNLSLDENFILKKLLNKVKNRIKKIQTEREFLKNDEKLKKQSKFTLMRQRKLLLKKKEELRSNQKKKLAEMIKKIDENRFNKAKQYWNFWENINEKRSNLKKKATANEEVMALVKYEKNEKEKLIDEENCTSIDNIILNVKYLEFKRKECIKLARKHLNNFVGASDVEVKLLKNKFHQIKELVKENDAKSKFMPLFSMLSRKIFTINKNKGKMKVELLQYYVDGIKSMLTMMDTVQKQITLQKITNKKVYNYTRKIVNKTIFFLGNQILIFKYMTEVVQNTDWHFHYHSRIKLLRLLSWIIKKIKRKGYTVTFKKSRIDLQECDSVRSNTEERYDTSSTN